MPQLRDSTTSELIATGTVADLVLIADELGDAVLWDDVPFDAVAGTIAVDFDAVRAHNAERLDALAGDDARAERSRRASIVKASRDVRSVAKSAKSAGETLPPVEIG